MGWSMNRARKGGMLLFALCVVPILGVTGASDWGAVLLIGLAGAAHQAFSANLFTTVSDSFPKQAVASIIGIGGMAGAIGGMLFPIVTGMLLDSYKASGNVSAGYGILFAFCAGAYLVSLLTLQILNPRLEPVRMKTA
jgi:ACS family hexuronate transporter-like MFS transporter